MKLSDFVIKFLESKKIDTVFTVSGGGSIFLCDALYKARKIKYIACHHEQAVSYATESYSRIKNKPAVVCVTTWPGGINAINGVFGAYTDSVPMIVISWQVKKSTNLVIQKKNKLRQLGDQENNIIYMVKKITKNAVLINNKNQLLKNFKVYYILLIQPFTYLLKKKSG